MAVANQTCYSDLLSAGGRKEGKERERERKIKRSGRSEGRSVGSQSHLSPSSVAREAERKEGRMKDLFGCHRD